MDRRYSIQPIILKDSKEDEDKKASAYEANRRGSVVVTNYGKTTRSWVKRSNLAPEHAKPFPETRSSWDESMRRRDSDQGLRGIVLRKGFSDDSKNYSLFHNETRRASKVEPSFFYSGKRLCKWETVNLLGMREKSAAEEVLAAAAGKRRGQTELKVLCKIPSGEDSGIEVASASTTSSALSSKFSHSYLDNVSESEERHDYYVLDVEGESSSPLILDSPRLHRLGGQARSLAISPRDFDYTERYTRATDRFPSEDYRSEESTPQDMTTDGQTRDNVPVHVRREGPDDRRPSIIPTLNITKEQSNYEKFLNIISTNKDIPNIGAIVEIGSISRTKSCEALRKEQEDDMSIWERRNRKAGDFSPGTRPIMLNIEAIDDSMFWSKSGSNTLVSSSSRSETYICKDDLHLSLRKLAVTSGGDSRSGSPGLGVNEGGHGFGDGAGRYGSKLRKPTNLWGVTRRISVKRKKVTKEEKKEEAPTEQSEEPPR